MIVTSTSRTAAKCLSALAVIGISTQAVVIDNSPAQRQRQWCGGRGGRGGVVCAATDAPLGDLSAPVPPKLDAELYESAKTKLPWEILVEKEGRPVLNLSEDRGEETVGEGRALALSEEAAAEVASGGKADVGADGRKVGLEEDYFVALDEADTESSPPSWESGEHWAQTRLDLVDLWVLPRDMSNGADSNYATAATKAEKKMLSTVPQLLRLPPSQVVGTANAVLDAGLPPALLRSEPKLLSFPPDYIEGGLEFLQTMMMAPSRDFVVTACKSTPGLLAGAVEGWIQEQTVKRALGAASQATYGANKQIAGDAAQAFQAMKKKKEGGPLS